MAFGILGVQIAAILFGLFMIYYTFLHYKRKEIDGREYAFWAVTWLIFIIIAIIPEIFDYIVFSALDLPRRMDFFIIIGFMFFSGMIVYTYMQTKKQQKKLEDLVRAVAIKKK